MASDPSAATQAEAGESDENDLLARHRQELKDLRARIQALKKSIPKGDKKKKKEVGAEIAQLEQDLEQRQKREVEGHRKKGTDGDVSIHQGVADLSLVSEEAGAKPESSQEGKKSRAQKRKEKKAQRDHDRDRRIAEGEAEAAEDNPRLKEREKLTSSLTPLGLTIKDITPDGHCLYAALVEQISLRLGRKSSVSELRSQCADYIHSHSDDFLPFLTDPDSGNQFNQDQFAQYCTDIADTATWGGQLEIRALSHVYCVPIKVYQADTPVLVIGEEYPDDGKALTLAYHLHEYGLGEHYNSVVPR